MGKITKTSKHLSIIATAIIVIIGILVTLGLTTQAGLRLTISAANELFLPGKIEVSALKGNLIGPISAKRISYKDQEIQLSAQQFQFNYNAAALVKSLLYIGKSDIHPTLKLQQLKAKFKSSSMTLDTVNATLHTAGKKITTMNATLRSNRASVTLQGKIHPQWAMRWKVNIPKLQDLIKEGSGSFTTEGEITGAYNTPTIKGRLSAHQLSLKNLLIKKMVGTISGNGNLTIQLSPGSFSFPQIKSLQPFSYNSARITTTLNKRGLQSRLLLFLPDHQPITAKISLPKYRAKRLPSSKERLQGELNWKTTRLDFLPLLFPQLTKTTGNLSIQMRLSGTVSKPRLEGTARLNNGSAELPLYGINLQNIAMNIRSKGSRLTYQGSATSGGGTIKIDGNTSLTKRGFPSQIKLTGNTFLISNTPELQIFASPNINVTTLNKKIEITGTIDIPKANLKPRDFRQTVTLPSDVRFVNGGEPAEEGAYEITSSINLSLGDQVSLSLMGLTGQMTGSLAITDSPDRGTLATGQLTLKNGSYNAQGQKLKLTQGDLLFTGGPINNPGLNIQATRNVKATSKESSSGISTISNVMVGINIQGTLKRPKTTLFSSPTGLNQAEILSYLILGQPLSSVSASNAQMLLQAANLISFGSGKTTSGIGSLTTGITQSLGLSTFGFEHQQLVDRRDPTQEELIDHTAFVLGKYLSPKLYVSYSLGVLDNINRFYVRYIFNKSWSVQSESSTLGNGVDLLYTIERN